MNRLAFPAFPLCAVALPLGTALPAAAQSPSKSYLFQERQLGGACPPPL